MDVLKQIQEPLVLVASIIVALTTVIGAYEKWWLKPRDARKEKERQAEREEMLKLVEVMAEPFKEFSQASEADRLNLNKIAEVNVKTIGEHEIRLDNHNDRLIVLEVKNDVRTVGYKEEE